MTLPTNPESRHSLRHVDDTVGCVIDGLGLSHLANVWVRVWVDSRNAELVGVRATQVTNGRLKVSARGQKVTCGQKEDFAHMVHKDLGLVVQGLQEGLK